MPNILKFPAGFTIGISADTLESGKGMKLCKLDATYYGCLVMGSDLLSSIFVSFYRDVSNSISVSGNYFKSNLINFYKDNNCNLYIKVGAGSLTMPIVFNMYGEVYMEFISAENWPSGLTQIV